MRNLGELYRDQARLNAIDASARLHRSSCSDIGALPAFLETVKGCRFTLEECGDPVSSSMLLQMVSDKLEHIRLAVPQRPARLVLTVCSYPG